MTTDQKPIHVDETVDFVPIRFRDEDGKALPDAPKFVLAPLSQSLVMTLMMKAATAEETRVEDLEDQVRTAIRRALRGWNEHVINKNGDPLEYESNGKGPKPRCLDALPWNYQVEIWVEILRMNKLTSDELGNSPSA